MAIHQLVLTPISDFSLLSEVAIMWQTDNIVYKLKLRSFYKSAHLQVYLADFYSWYEPHLMLWQLLDTKSNDHTTSKSLKVDI